MGAATTGLLLDNVTAVLRGLAMLPTSPETRELTDQALECERVIKAWDTKPPTAVERMTMHDRVLALYGALSKLKRA